MPIGLLGTKVGMTQVYNDEGKVYPVTVIKLGPCPVLQVRDMARDGYDAVQIGFEEKPRRKATCLLYTSPSPRDRTRYRMPSSA